MLAQVKMKLNLTSRKINLTQHFLPGATTLGIMTRSIMTLGVMTLSKMTLSIMTFSITTLSIMAFSIMTKRITFK
jgi:hypothetical protein